MNAQTLVAKVWNFAHVLRDQGVSYQAYISQISYLLFLKMDEERSNLIGEPSMLPEGARWDDIKDLIGEALETPYRQVARQAVEARRHHRRDLPESTERDPGPGQTASASSA